eukprot:TRINITY_DN1411_c1_g1_i3.p1 TRINITY_DN1411_c1_g1~~TRINITY_DN1411_c1_g1_i3.p1  ORF type:complete len:891 (+),score=174.81 TRINITY_DN1411_c1_g1_i3:123-2795(+)
MEDNFATTTTNRETVPRTGILLTCSMYNWTGVSQPGGFVGDAQEMGAAYFDTKPKDNALVWSVTGLPTDALLQNARIEMNLKCEDSMCHNDGYGFMWDNNSCRFPYFRQWTNLTSFGNWTTGNIKFVNISLTSDIKVSADKTLLQRIKETGYFHFLVGDDTSVDYFRLFYTVADPPSSSLVSFSCATYLLGRTLAKTSVVYSDTTSSTITNIIDSASYPFTSTSLISTANSDRNVTQSTFKFYITQSTRFWLFVPSGVTLGWISDGGWDSLTGASVTTTTSNTATNRTFVVYTKRYDGPRWVIFGGASSSSSAVSPAMFFVSWTFAQALIVTPSNPSAVCACESTGDPHYVTWDKRRFDFYTPGTYHLVKARDCTFDVQTLTFKYGPTVAVNGIVSVRYLNDVVTLARTPGAAGALWTGSPVVRVNGVIQSASVTQGGLQVNKITVDQWTIVISAVGLTVKTVAAGNWFHVYPTLSDPSYQRKVDGLCGNCDNNPDNDFMTPGCAIAINNTATKLTCNQAADWGVKWTVPTNQLVADLSVLSSTNIGSNSYSSCTSTPIIQQCPSLIPPEPPKTGTTAIVIEPQAPTTFVSCSTSGTPVHCGGDDDHDDDDDDDNDNDQPPKLCTWRTEYNQITLKCTECANSNLYASDDCILDICQLLDNGKTIGNYSCPPGPQVCNYTTITKNVTIGSYDWATLDNANPDGVAPSTPACQDKAYYIPLGWEVAPNDATSKSVAESKNWETACLVVEDGNTFATNTTKVDGYTGSCPVHSCVVQPVKTCYHPNFCGTKLLLRRPRVPQCQNGIIETGEQCDDGNGIDTDGCSNTCRINTNGWICVTNVNPTQCTGSANNDAGDPKHTCSINSPYCEGCVITVANQNDKSCCKCVMPCCD